MDALLRLASGLVGGEEEDNHDAADVLPETITSNAASSSAAAAVAGQASSLTFANINFFPNIITSLSTATVDHASPTTTAASSNNVLPDIITSCTTNTPTAASSNNVFPDSITVSSNNVFPDFITSSITTDVSPTAASSTAAVMDLKLINGSGL